MDLEIPFFSIIMPVYNRELFISKSVESALSQTYSNFELLCIDDGSTDSSGKIILDYCKKDSRVRCVYQENKGRCMARNAGIKNAKADWICFLDSDDIYYPNHLEILSKLIIQFPNYLAFATEQLVKEKLKQYSHQKLNSEYYVLTLMDNIKSNPIQLNQLCYNKKKINIFFPDENIPVSEDWLFIRQLTLLSPILKTNIITNKVIEHPQRTMNSIHTQEIVKWNYYTAEYFTKSNTISNTIKTKIMSHTALLCTNIFLSANNKKNALLYFRKSLMYYDTFLNSLFYKAIVKFFS